MQRDKSDRKDQMKIRSQVQNSWQWQLHDGEELLRVSGERPELEVTPWEEVPPWVCLIKLQYLHMESSASTQSINLTKEVELY